MVEPVSGVSSQVKITSTSSPNEQLIKREELVEATPISSVQELKAATTKAEVIIKSSTDATFESKLSEFRLLACDLDTTGSIVEFLNFDAKTFMPQEAKDYREWQINTFQKFYNDILSSDEMAKLLLDLLYDSRLSADDAALVQKVWSEYDKEIISISQSQEGLTESPSAELAEFKSLCGDMQAMYTLEELLDWHARTYAADEEQALRGKQLGFIAKHKHQTLTSERMGELLKHLQGRLKDAPGAFSDVDKALLRVIKDEYDKKFKVPASLVEEITLVSKKLEDDWERARKTGVNYTFENFVPQLKKVIELKRKYAEFIGYEKSVFDPLIDEKSPGMTAEKLDKLFEELRNFLVPFIKATQDSPNKPDTSFLKRHCSKEEQWMVGEDILKTLGVKARVDKSQHPFSSSCGLNDGRLSNRVSGEDLFSLMTVVTTALHEGAGHNEYEPYGIDPSLAKTPLFTGASIGIHESQSRFWEIIIGQSKPFWEFYYPRLQELLPKQLSDITLDQFYKAINEVKPSFIRVDADEVTYNLHIIIRWKIEKALFEGTLAVEDAKDAFNKKMYEYLGITPENDALGILQDVHWFGGLNAYFHTYSEGNVLAPQILHAIKEGRYEGDKDKIPDLDEKIRTGNFEALKAWQKDKIHKHGKMLTPGEIIKNATGEDGLNTSHFIKNIRDKYGEIYSLETK